MQAKNESTKNPVRSTLVSPTPPAASPSPPSPAARPGARKAPPGNAFSAAFLEVARHLELRREAAGGDAPFAAGGPGAGPFAVVPVAAGRGTLWAVARATLEPGEPYAEGGGAVAVFVERTAALLAAAVLPASATPNHVQVAQRSKRLGLPVHDGKVHLGHLAPASSSGSDRLREHLPRDLHVARHLATHPDALVLLAEALDYETLVLFGRALMRRLERAVATTLATA
jgi:hypothetical protein